MKFSKLVHMKNAGDMAFHMLFLKNKLFCGLQKPQIAPGKDLLGCSDKACLVSRAGCICCCECAQCCSAQTLFAARLL